MDAVEIELAVLEKQQGPRAASENLPTQLRADGATSAGHQNHLTLDTALEQILPRRHRITPEKIGYVDLLNVLDLHSPAGQVSEARHAANMQCIGL